MENLFSMKNSFVVCGAIFLIINIPLAAQDYHAVQGSSYAGSLGIANNPSSMLSTPFQWDLTLLGVQFKSSTNILTVHNFSILSPSKKSQYSINEGDFKRKARMSFNLNLFNARITLNRRQAIGFGVNLRAYARIKTDVYNYNDSIGNVRDFFNLNSTNRQLNGSFMGSSWLEIFGSYSRTIWDRPQSRLNAGLTLKASRGISGAFAKLEDIRFQNQIQPGQQYYELKAGKLSYGYSSNYDKWNENKNTHQNTRDFLAYTEGGLSLDAGVEYFIKSGAVPAFDEDDYYDYDWKIGASLLDLGLNQFKYGNGSRSASGIRTNITDTSLEQKFQTISNLDRANDSLATMVNSFSVLTGKFIVINPARLVINVDRFLYDAFYVNGELSLNLSALAGNKYYHVEELNLLTLTPRWETKNLGIYLPIQLTATGNFWVGGAFKAGPLLLGVHNWANVFSKKKIQKGGGYLAIVIRPGKNVEGKKDRRLNCPK